ncbi:MAG TPA: CsbD family protein [Gaiellaceae bacterium]
MGNWDQVEGEAKQKIGDLTDDESTETEGHAQEAWGDAKEKADDVADEIKDRT